MPPRGSEGYDFTPILTHYLFLFTTILAVVCHSLFSNHPSPSLTLHSLPLDRMVRGIHWSGSSNCTT